MRRLRWVCLAGALWMAAAGLAGEPAPTPADDGNLLANASFEEPVMPPAWRFTVRERDPDGVRLFGSTGAMDRVAGAAPDGGHWLEARGVGPVTLVSAAVPRGEGVFRLTGQYAADSLSSAMHPRGAGGVVELAGFDADGAVVERRFALEAAGTCGWTPFAAEATFSARVDQIRVVVRFYEIAFGAFRLDELRLARPPASSADSDSGKSKNIESTSP